MKRKIIDLPQIRAAAEELESFRRSRAAFHARVADEEEFYRMRVRPRAHSGEEGESFAPTSAWLLNTVLQKHADLMEHVPTATCLAREPGDEEDAKALSSILPVILERNRFEATYSDNMWYKLKHGVCAYGVFWNNTLEGGLGDVDLRRVELMNLFWEPGVRDIQHSRSVYLIEQTDLASLRASFPDCDVKADAVGVDGMTERVTVVDWYYKKPLPGGGSALHYCKFAGDCVLFATENEEGYERGWYEHGQYPFVLDVLYPIEGECVGFGVIALARDAQLYIDRMDRNLLEYLDWATRVRFFCKKNTGVSEKEFTDLSRRIVEVEGDLDEERLRQIRVEALDEFWLALKNAKIDELKETTSNRDVLQGSADGGVIAASAIAALQEAGNKTMRDIVSASYRAFVGVVSLVIECVRQFYSEARYFRILGSQGEHRFIQWSNQSIAGKACGHLASGEAVYRRPVFDIDVRAEKKDPYTRITHNEILKELYALGVFKPENARQASILLSAMDFSGIARVRAQVEQNATLSAAQNKAEKTPPPASVGSAGEVACAEKAREMAVALQERAEELSR